MASNNWKNQERRIARMFGSHRTPLSGINSRHTSSDIIHEKLYVECKYRKRIAILDLMEGVIEEAKKEDKIPVLALKSRECQDDFFLLRKKDLLQISALVKECDKKSGCNA